MDDGRFPRMNLSHRWAVVRGLQRLKGTAGSGVLWRVPIVDAYLFRHVWQAAREGAAMFAGLVFVFAIVSGAREGGEPLETSVWLRALALQIPRVLSFTLPMALLYGCIKAFSELSGRGELVALSAAGQGWPRVLRAPLLLGLLAGLGALLLQEWAVPRSEQAHLLVLQSAAQSRALSGFQMTHTASGDGFRQIVNARAADFAPALLHAPVVKELRPDGSLRRQIVATRGQWDDRAAAMVFQSGWILELPAFSMHTKDVKPQTRVFERLEVQGFPPPERWSGVRTLRDMIAAGQFEALSLSELQTERATTSRRARSVVPGSDAQVSTLTFAIHDRFAAPLVCLALVLIGCPLGLRVSGAPSISPLSRALGVLLFYFAVWLSASYFGKSSAPVPLLWAYFPLLLLVCAGLALLRRKAL
jgi:lipopolysaccharide export LptBFGC system permease protein LptF